MALHLDTIHLSPIHAQRIRDIFLAWDGLAGRLAGAKIEEIRNAIKAELAGEARSSLLRKLVARYNALQAKENEADLARGMVGRAR